MRGRGKAVEGPEKGSRRSRKRQWKVQEKADCQPIAPMAGRARARRARSPGRAWSDGQRQVPAAGGGGTGECHRMCQRMGHRTGPRHWHWQCPGFGGVVI